MPTRDTHARNAPIHCQGTPRGADAVPRNEVTAGGQQIFEKEMRLLRRDAGIAAVERAWRVMALGLRWLRCHGHGNLQFSAVNHMLGQKIRGDTVFTEEGN